MAISLKQKSGWFSDSQCINRLYNDDLPLDMRRPLLIAGIHSTIVAPYERYIRFLMVEYATDDGYNPSVF